MRARDSHVLGVKAEILQFIIDNPSAHLRKIKSSLGYSIGTVQHHIKNLEKEGKIKSTKGFYRNYYFVDDYKHKALMNLLNLETPRKIIIHLLQHESANQSQLADITGFTSSTISFHMKKLVSLGVVNLRYDGKFSVYSIKNKENLIPILSRYSFSTWGSMVSSMTDLFASFQDNA